MKRTVLPEPYQAAKRIMRVCARDFSPASYLAVALALQAIERRDPCEQIADLTVRLAAYTAIANDNELERLAYRIQRKHKEWRAAE